MKQPTPLEGMVLSDLPEQEWQTSSELETRQIGQFLGKELPNGAVLCLFGDLGAGKTTLIKGLVSAATGTSESKVHSPTFTYMTDYEGDRTVYHFDLYRLSDAEEFYQMGFDEYFYRDGICCLEWSERLEQHLPEPRYELHLSHAEEENRRNIRLLVK